MLQPVMQRRRKHNIMGGGGGARLMVSAVCGKTSIFFIQDKILLGGNYWGAAK